MKGKLGRGFLLALGIAACMTIKGRVDFLAAYTLQDGFFVALTAMLFPGALLGSLPGRFRSRGKPKTKSTWRGCSVSFACGAAMILGAGFAFGGDGMMLAGFCQGSVSAVGFLGISTLAALLTARLRERRQAA